ncbi:thioredoxin family protein [bacterium]|nr:thioredoxin family protein [bacterium]
MSSFAAKFDVRSIPTIVFLKDGKEQFRFVGYRPIADVEGYVNKLLAIK